MFWKTCAIYVNNIDTSHTVFVCLKEIHFNSGNPACSAVESHGIHHDLITFM